MMLLPLRYLGRYNFRLGMHEIVDILQAHFAASSNIFRIRSRRKHHEIRRYCPDNIIDHYP
jgi:hypothetical protein